jgi:hypothetical protein
VALEAPDALDALAKVVEHLRLGLADLLAETPTEFVAAAEPRLRGRPRPSRTAWEERAR